jgi:purine-binding chemotaxis protein CheW
MKNTMTNKFDQEKKSQELLKDRAKKLALKITDAHSKTQGGEDSRDYVQFRVGGDAYALEISIVKEVLEPDEIVDVPCTPAFILGVVSVRGHICSVVDLRLFLKLPDVNNSMQSKVLSLSSGDIELGIIIDEVTDVFSISRDEIKPLSSGLADADRYSVGITENRVVILDGLKLLADPQLVVNEVVAR